MRNPKRYDGRWARTASADLDAIVEYVARDGVDVGASVLEKLERTAESLVVFPLRGRVVPELAAFGIHAYRELIVAPWRIIYRVSGRTVYVLAVVDSRRNLEDLLLNRFVR